MKIPEIDFSSYDENDGRALAALADALNEALAGVGFLSLRNIGIDESLRDAVFAASKAFFAQPEAEKRKLGYSDAEDNFGYQGIREESLKPGSPPDLKEALTLRDLNRFRGLDWPQPGFRDLLTAFNADCTVAAFRVMRVFAIGLEVDRDYFVRRHTGENVTMRLLHYPPLPPDGSDQLGAGPHTDYGLLTLLFQDMAGGLEVQDRDGGWQPVTPKPGNVVINAGDLLERWTNKRYRSSLHRVRARPGGGHRYAVAFFVDPDSRTLVECLPSCVGRRNPPQFGPTTAGEHILAKIRATQA